MSEDLKSQPPRSFYIIGAAALVWNLIGVMQYVLQVTMNDAAIAALPANQQIFIHETPGWATAAFAIATNSGALACVLLLLRKNWAYPLFIVSMLGVLVQNIHSFAVADGLEVFGGAGAALTVLVLGIAAVMIWYSKSAEDNGWIS